jgi:ribosomal-protein-alanine N-acetyltransferase
LYDSCGFVEIGVRRNYYPLANGKREDAVMMALPLRANFS